MQQPIDLTTGLPCGVPAPAADGTVEVPVGYLATHADGTTALLRLDRARADMYAQTHHALIERVYVRRPASAPDRPAGQDAALRQR